VVGILTLELARHVLSMRGQREWFVMVCVCRQLVGLQYVVAIAIHALETGIHVGLILGQADVTVVIGIEHGHQR